MTDSAVLAGLTDAEVAERRERGQTNDVGRPTSRTTAEIIRANVFTRFNAMLGTLLVVILLVGEPRDALFGIVLVLNSGIGILQELRAKETLDELSVINAPQATVVRDGRPQEHPAVDIVLDDVLVVGPGDQIVVDGVVLDALGLEVDESLLTGESDPTNKRADSDVRSGSFVSAGSGHYQATHVGEDAYAYKLAAEAKQFSLVGSELRDGVDRILQVIQWLMIPMAILLVTNQLRHNEDIVSAVQGSVAGLGAMIPEGLVLLTSLAFVVGVIRLGQKNVLTQELAAVEGLARIDVICLDKTGTMTADRLDVAGIEPIGAHSAAALGALAAADPRPNATLQAIAAAFPPPLDEGVAWQARQTMPFSSARKWSAADFGPDGAWLLGAPDILVDRADESVADEVTRRVEAHAEAGLRVVLLALAPSGLTGDEVPDDVDPAALVLLEEQVRPEAPDTIGYFGDQGITVKVISGDHPRTVGAVARRCGVPGADEPFDARGMPSDEQDFADIVEQRSVFGRVTPQQKRAMVGALQSRGHTVAMTGDGVNDVLALKDADIGVSMGSGSGATRAVARFVLLDNSFAVFPDVVAEGRRVIANVERVANLFITKTVYATLLVLAVGLAGLPFPFFPRHLTIVSALTIGIPAFFLALAPNSRRYRPGFLGRVLRFAIPAGGVAAAATFASYALARAEDLPLIEAQTVATMVLFWVALWVLSILARPLSSWRLWLIVSMAAAFLLILFIPSLRSFFALELPDLVVFFAAIGVAAIACGVLEILWRAAGWIDRTPGLPDLGIAPEDDEALADEKFPLHELIDLSASIPGVDKLTGRAGIGQSPDATPPRGDADDPGQGSDAGPVAGT